MTTPPKNGFAEAPAADFVADAPASWVPHRPERPEKSEGGIRFRIESAFEPKGDQPQAIDELASGVAAGERDQVLLGVTGSGKTFTMAQVVEREQRPTLVLAHNKTLAAQLYGEFKSFFPDNAVEYFVSYYDYYQPEAYVPRTDTYIEKESNINEQIDRMRHSATRALFERRRCADRRLRLLHLRYRLGGNLFRDDRRDRAGAKPVDQRQLLRDLVALQYRRNDAATFVRGTFRVRGDVIEIFPAHYEDRAWRVSLFGDEVEDHHRIRSPDRSDHGRTGKDQALSQLPLCDAAPDAQPGDFANQIRN